VYCFLEVIFFYSCRTETKLTRFQADNGTLTFWDYDTGTPFQNLDDIPQPGSLEAEAGVFCSTFDVTGTRLITGGADKTIKVSVLTLRVPPRTDCL
jgi:WD40 repeat protein